MSRFLLYFAIGFASCLAIFYYALAAGSLGGPWTNWNFIAFAGALLLIAASYFSLKRPRLGSRLAFFGLCAIWPMAGMFIFDGIAIHKYLFAGALALIFITLSAYSAIFGFFNRSEQHPASPAVRKWIYSISLLIFLAFAAWIFHSCAKSSRHPLYLEVPQSYSGWVFIQYEVPGAPPLPIEDGDLRARIPADGVLQTSSTEESGWARDRYFYYDSSGKLTPLKHEGGGGQVWDGSWVRTSRKSIPITYQRFFIGSESEFNQHPSRTLPQP